MTALAVSNSQDFWNEKQLAALKTMGLADATQADLAVLLAFVQKTGLDPFTRQLYMVKRGGKFTTQASIDGFRVIADRACQDRGWLRSEGPTEWFDAEGHAHTEWLRKEAPTAARYTVKILTPSGEAEFSAVARYDEYSAGGGMWGKMPALMIAKCAEALALRKAFPQDLSGIYSDEEMAQADEPKAKPKPKAKVVEPKQWTDEQREQVLDIFATGLDNLTMDDCRDLWKGNEEILDCPLPDGMTLRTALLEIIQGLKEAS